MGFLYAASGPLVRSSYKAAEVFVRSILRPSGPEGPAGVLESRLAEARAAAESVAGSVTVSELAARQAVNLLRDGAADAPASLITLRRKRA
jgi:lipoic acid synthetase